MAKTTEGEARDLAKEMASAISVFGVKFSTLVRNAHADGYAQGCRDTKDQMARDLGWTEKTK